MTAELYFSYVIACVIVLAIPGPTILLVISYSLSHGRKAALPCVAGVTLGDATAASASLMGLGAILATSATAFAVVKWIGALYLLWIAFKMWNARGTGVELEVPGELTKAPIAKRLFLHAYTVTTFNPKGIVFFIAFLPHFVATDAPIAPQLLLLGATFTILGALNATVYAYAASGIRKRLGSARNLRIMNRVGAGILAGAAAWTAAVQRTA